MADNTYEALVPWADVSAQFAPNSAASGDGSAARKAAGIDFPVVEKALFFADDFTGEAVRIDKFKAVVRQDTQKELSVMGEGYHALQQSQYFQVPDDLVKAGRTRYAACGSLVGDRVVWMLTHGKRFEVGKGKDLVEPMVLWSASYDGSLANQAALVPVRVSSGSMLTPQPEDARVILGIRHASSGAVDPDEEKRVLHALSKQVEGFQDLAEKLVKRRLSSKEMEKLSAVVFPDKPGEPGTPTVKGRYYREKLLALFEEVGPNAGTAWSAWGAVCEFIDHHRNTRVAGVTADESSPQEARLYSSWYGKNRRAKLAAVEALLKGL